MFVVNNVGNLYNWLLAVKRLAVWIKSEKNRKKYLITSKNWLKVWALSGLVKKTTKVTISIFIWISFINNLVNKPIIIKFKNGNKK